MVFIDVVYAWSKLPSDSNQPSPNVDHIRDILTQLIIFPNENESVLGSPPPSVCARNELATAIMTVNYVELVGRGGFEKIAGPLNVKDNSQLKIIRTPTPSTLFDVEGMTETAQAIVDEIQKAVNPQP